LECRTATEHNAFTVFAKVFSLSITLRIGTAAPLHKLLINPFCDLCMKNKECGCLYAVLDTFLQAFYTEGTNDENTSSKNLGKQ
jgi:hypothetical protein